jgi:hypothetical protein
MGMMWTIQNRPRYNRDKLRYPSDLTDEEWGHLEHLIPPAKCGGRRRKVDEREVLNAPMGDFKTGSIRNTPPWGMINLPHQAWTQIFLGSLGNVYQLLTSYNYLSDKPVSLSGLKCLRLTLVAYSTYRECNEFEFNFDGFRRIFHGRGCWL